jgi:tetratricopeptide (TPR) repeat protein
MTDQNDFFIAGGTLRATAPSYVTRPADQELYESARAGEFCYVLTSRQMGKSSLMVRTARRLKEAGVATVLIDLTSIGTVAVDLWYVGLLTRIKADLRLDVDPTAWWQERQAIGAPQRFVDFLREVVLAQLDVPVVIFVDEIDSTLNLDFRDDFFAAIRSIYNARAGEPVFRRLTFVLLGVATPTDLIQDRARTPFNIGRQIVLQEFSYVDALPLREGLEGRHPGQGDQIFAHIFDWTSGHPYLTQKLCLAAAQHPPADWDEHAVDMLVEASFFSASERKDTNLTFVQDRIRASPPAERRRMLKLYRRVYSGEAVPDDDRSQIQNHLELFGLLGVEGDKLRVRNQIYRRVFDQDWIANNMPADRQRNVAIGAGAVALLLLIAIVYIIRNPTTSSQAQAEVCRKNFEGYSSSAVRLQSLACLFERGYNEQALRLFYGQLSPTEQKYLFLASNPQIGSEVVAVVRGVYVTLDPQMPHSQEMMNWMVAALAQSQQPDVKFLEQEIALWKRGRELAAQGQYQEAIALFNQALLSNKDNPAALYDRAMAHIGLQDYGKALDDLENMIRIAEMTPPTPTPLPKPTSLAPIQQTPVLAATDSGLKSQSQNTPTATVEATTSPTSTLSKSSQALSRFISPESIKRTALESVQNNANLLLFLQRNLASYSRLAAMAPSALAPTSLAQATAVGSHGEVISAGNGRMFRGTVTKGQISPDRGAGGSCIEGRVTTADGGLFSTFGVQIDLRGHTLPANEDIAPGSYSICGLPAGEWTVSVYAAGGVDIPASEQLAHQVRVLLSGTPGEVFTINFRALPGLVVPTPTSEPIGSSYDGQWSGQLSGKTAGDVDFNGSFRMEVRAGAIYRIAIDGPTCLFETYPNFPNGQPIEGNQFAISGSPFNPVNETDNSITFSVRGTFASSTQASGSLSATQNGSSCAVATWTADKR